MTSARRFDAVTVVLCAVIVAVPVAAMAGALNMRDDPALEPEPTIVSTVMPTAPTPLALPPQPLTIDTATVATPAARSEQIQITQPPAFDPVGYVNGLAYCWTCMRPAMEAYRVVAAWYGWDAETIEARAGFVEIIMATESAGCWNARRWTTGTAVGRPCLETRPGIYDDAGFGQITNVLRPLTCEKAGICTTADTVASPWQSMLAYVVVLDELGKRPWCYLNNTHVRNGHCARWPA